MSACCTQCLQYALRSQFAGTKKKDSNGEQFEPLSEREANDWGKGHFLCGPPNREELLAVLEQGVTVSLRDNTWQWVA